MTEYITVYEAAKILETTPQWVRKLCRKKILDAHKPGRDWSISRSSVEAYKENKQKDRR